MILYVDKYFPKEIYTRNRVGCILCSVRQKLIKQTPEENIRQAFIGFLITEKSVPPELIDVEIPLSRIKKGNKKRADIIVYGNNKKENVILVIECKKNEHNIIDRNIDQAKYYNRVFNANFIIVTNGRTFETHKRNGNSYHQLSIIPNFNQLRDNHSLTKHIIKHEPYQRHTFKELSLKSTHKYFKEWGHIGVDTPIKFHSFLSNLIDFIFDKNTSFENLKFNDIEIIKDLGTKYDSFGNSGGGSWEGEYKKLLVKEKSGNHLTIGIGVMGGAKQKNHPRFGTTKGCTYLIISIDDFEKSHNSLQLNLDKHLIQIKNDFIISHDGKLSSGHSGSLPYLTVKNYIKKMAPHLICDDKIILGNLSNCALIKDKDNNAIQFIKNIIEYSILRDALRRGER